EYAAACVAGVLSLEDGMRLAVARGELMHRMPPGAMLAVALPETQVVPLLTGRLTLAAVNAPDRCVVSGPVEEVERLKEELERRKAGAVRMPAPHAFHSADVEPLMPELARVVGSLHRSEPTVRYVSSLTGTFVRPGQLTAPGYWTEQMRQPVRFTDAVGALLEEGCGVLLEVGPGQDLTPLVRASLGQDRERVRALATLRRGGTTTEQQGWLQGVGELWSAGVAVDWSAFYAHEQRLRLHLPTYAFQEKDVWVQARARALPSAFMPPGAPVRAPQNVSPASVTASASGAGSMTPVHSGVHGTVSPTASSPPGVSSTYGAQGGVAPRSASTTYGAQGPVPSHTVPTTYGAQGSVAPQQTGAMTSGAQGPVPSHTASTPYGTPGAVDPQSSTHGSMPAHTVSFGAQDTATLAFGTPTGEAGSSAPFAGRAPVTQSGQGALAPTGRVATVTLSPSDAPSHAGPVSPNLPAPTAGDAHPFGATPPPVSVPSIAQSLHDGAFHPTGSASHAAPDTAHSAARPLLPGLSAHTASESLAPAAVPVGREDAPRGDVEERVAALWRERLGLDFVGREENFLEIGGNSLTAAQLLNQVRDTFGVQLPLAALFEAPTVAGIAQRLEPLLRQAPQAQVSVELPLVPLPRTRELALSFVQERVWRLEQHLPGLSAYNIPFVLRLDGVVEADVLERGIQEIVHRHEALRTTYDVVDGRPVQRFHAHVRIPLTRVELRGPLETREAEALRIAREDAAAPFDLVKGPVMRSTLVRLDTHVHMLVVSIHHIVCDTLSVALFVQELGQLYDAFLQGRPSPLPPLPLQYADFGQWQRQSIAESRLPEQEQWWRQRLAGMPRQIDLPTDRPRTAHSRTLNSARMTMEMPPALARELSAFSRREG
ncbi:MAG: acyltransferase domain-containing protein, partial [Myxococcaceae bacterium]